MQENKQQYIQEDEIDLRELFKTVWDAKKFILIFTFLATSVSIVFVLTKTPIYEAKALVEIGSYKLSVNNSNSNSNSNSNVLIENTNQLSKKLNILFIDMNKNIKDKKSEITSISVPKRETTFIEVKSNAISNELAKKKIESVLKYIKSNHGKILDDVKRRREFQISNIERKIKNINNNEIELLNEKISLQKNAILVYENQLKTINDNLKKIKDTDPALLALKVIEKRDISNFILRSKLQVVDYENRRGSLVTSTLTKLQEEKNLIQSLLLPHNYKNSEIVGEILVNDYPIKPKKKLIVVVSFVTSIILSILIVFFMNFIRGLKEK